MYFLRVIETRDKIGDADTRMQERAKKLRALRKEKKRRPYIMPQKEPPRGLERLSLRKQREYKAWLASADERETYRREHEEKEELRIAEVESRIAAIVSEQEADAALLESLETEHGELIALDVLSGEYTATEPMVTIARFLAQNRADTLMEAINLYHQELHWQRMEDIASEQRNAALAMQKQQQLQQRRQQRYMEQMAAEQNARLDSIQQSADEARFFSELNFWLDL